MSRHPHAAAAAAAATPPPAVGTPRTWTRWTWGRQQSVARILAGTMPVVTLLIATVADPTARLQWLLLGVAGGLLVARRPDSVLPLLVWLAVGGVWYVTSTQVTWWCLAAAAAAAIGHAATAFAAGAPDDAEAPRVLLRLWAARMAVVLAVTTAVCWLAQGGTAPGRGGSAVWTIVALLCVTGWLIAVRVRD